MPNGFLEISCNTFSTLMKTDPRLTVSSPKDPISIFHLRYHFREISLSEHSLQFPGTPAVGSMYIYPFVSDTAISEQSSLLRMMHHQRFEIALKRRYRPCSAVMAFGDIGAHFHEFSLSRSVGYGLAIVGRLTDKSWLFA
ncbi:hypothetical protein CEXT_595011 [Caerostris extrusa]|uniref:Uncharacterized protein n=1 Tax=Caerostris extrusa TaxID=172846 RepID=A0AAV4QQL9_CAEEX|nr:hypothetical protein CEXT_595011 [Caerostris extrusa]